MPSNNTVGSIVRQVTSKLKEAIKSVEEIGKKKESENCGTKRNKFSD